MIKLLLIVSSPFIVAFDLEARVSGGSNISINDYPHSVFLSVYIENAGVYICGSSILNQKVLLTAAHCLSPCKKKNNKIDAYAGNSNNRAGLKFIIKNFLYHGNYDDNTVAFDIGLVALKYELPFGEFMKRVVIMQNPPLKSHALLAGWGYLDETNKVKTKWLHHVPQKIWSLSRCRDLLHNIPNGCICGGGERSGGYASLGDSGSALVIDGYVQIGIVSFKRPKISQSLTVYTDVPYYYDWIAINAEKIYCRSKDVARK